MKSKNHFPLLIIGGGSSGTAAAIEANRRQIPTLLVNGKLPIGGTCVNVGCVPSKYLIRAAQQYHQAQNSRFPGIQPCTPELHFPELMKGLRQLIERLRHEKYMNVLQHLPYVTVLEGAATFLDNHRVNIKGQVYSADRIIIATGSESVIPPIPGIESTPYFTNETIFGLEELPSHLAIIGAGFIGVELAQAFARLGSQVTLIEAQDSILPSLPQYISQSLHAILEKEGVSIFTKTKVFQVAHQDGAIRLWMKNGEGQEVSLEASHLLIATGRKARVETLAVEKAGIQLAWGLIQTDSYLRTSQSHIFAIGDCNQFPPFVYAAAYEGKLSVGNAFACCSEEMKPVDYSVFPFVLFTDPQVAIVGKEVKDDSPLYLPLEQVPWAIVQHYQGGGIWIYVKGGCVERVEILAPEGAELLSLFTYAIQKKVPIEELKQLHYPYLTLNEGIKLALLSIDMDVSLLSCCAS